MNAVFTTFLLLLVWVVAGFNPELLQGDLTHISTMTYPQVVYSVFSVAIGIIAIVTLIAEILAPGRLDELNRF